MLARLGEFPVGVFSADWTLLSWTPAWAVLLGDPGERTHVERNLVRAVSPLGPQGSRPGRCSRRARPSALPSSPICARLSSTTPSTVA
ncbi:hypothetical protein ABZ322_11010 [Streptomyces sp. NPDC006129]|uniref:MmyB family transcriptional regulator n=1 Tax=unclassified Streptomyces TaxID=2593676 RepID=UPI0033B7D6BE